MADYNINAVTRRVVFSGSAGVGPYAFTFEILAQTDIAVYKNSTKLTLTTDYAVTINANGTGSVTLVVAATGSDTITIIGSRAIERTTDFVTAGDLLASSLNEQLDSQIVMIQQLAEENKRTIKAPAYDPADVADGGTANLTLPAAADRSSKILAFDASGNPVAEEEIGDWKGEWAASTTYAKRDLIKDPVNYNIYRCNTSHTSSGSAPISGNADAAKWDIVFNVVEAGNSASAAAASAAAAAASEAAAAVSETNALASEVAAAASEAAAAASEVAAGSSETNAASSASSASTSATNAASSATSASNSASAASTSASNAATSASAASTSATSAASSASSAATSASNAATSESNASSSASSASSSASNAASSATAASNAQTAAETARDQALAAYDNFDDRYLGVKSSDPTLDNDGNALVAGALYFNSTTGGMKVYTGSSWVDAYVSGTGFVVKTGDTMTGTLNLPANGLTVGTNQLVASGGNVGIGATPSYKLDVNGTAAATSYVLNGNQHLVYDVDSSNIGVRVGAAGPYYKIGTTGGNNLRLDSSSGGDILLSVAGSEKMRIDSTGNVGIGASPTGNLDVSGTGGVTQNIKTSSTALYDGAYLNLRASGVSTNYGETSLQHIINNAADLTDTYFTIQQRTTSGGYVGNIYQYSYKNQFHAWSTSGSERMRIDTAGNVGIGTTPSYKLDVNGSIRIPQSGTTSYDKGNDTITPWINVKTDYGAAGNGSTDDTTAINNAIAAANASTNGAVIFFPPGNYVISAALTTINKSGVELVGSGMHNTRITEGSGTYTTISFISSTTEKKGNWVRDMYIDSSSKTGGYVISFDWVGDSGMNNVRLNNPYNGVSIRQTNNITIKDTVMENVRGAVGIYWFGDNSSRNGGNDFSDVLNLRNVIIGGVAAGSSPTATLIVVDGYCSSLYFSKLQLLRGNAAIDWKNTTDTTNVNYPAFFHGSELDCEYQKDTAITLTNGQGFRVSNGYVYGSTTGSGLVQGQYHRNLRVMNTDFGSNYVHGLTCSGDDIGLVNCNVFENSQQGSGTHTGATFSSTANRVQITNGIYGDMASSGLNYQSYGIDINSAANSQVVGVNTAGNVTGGIFGTPTQSAANI